MPFTSSPGKVGFSVTTQEMANQTSRALERCVDTKMPFPVKVVMDLQGLKWEKG